MMDIPSLNVTKLLMTTTKDLKHLPRSLFVDCTAPAQLKMQQNFFPGALTSYSNSKRKENLTAIGSIS